MPTIDRRAEAGWRRAASWGAMAIFYAGVCRIMLAPIFDCSHMGSASFGGDARLIIWTLAWDNHAILDRVPSLFDANIFYPATNALAYSEHLFGISLFTLPVYAATRNPVLAYNLVWLLSYLLTALAAHLVAWRHTRDHLASSVAGLAYAFCFFRMHHGHGHLHIIWGFWIPLSLVAMEAWIATLTWTRLAIFVPVVVLQALASWYQAVMILVADAVFLLWLIASERRVSFDRPRLMRLFDQAAVGAAIALGIVWMFARHYSVLRSGGPSEVAPGAADLAAYLMPPQNTFAGRWLMDHGVAGPRWIWGELTLYLGWIAIVLAAIGAIAAIREPALRKTRFFLVLAFVAVALASGPSSAEVAAGSWGWSPFGLLARIPGVALFRVPARFSELLTLALAVLAAGGCALLHARFGRAGRLVTIAAIPLMLADWYVVGFPGGPPAPFPIPAVYRFVASVPSVSPQQVSAGSASSALNVADAVVSLPDYAGTAVWFNEPDYQYFSTAHWHPIANGYSRIEPAGFDRLMQRIKTFPSAESLTAMRDVGIRYVIVHGAQLPAVAEAARATAGVRLLRSFDTDHLFEVLSR